MYYFDLLKLLYQYNIEYLLVGGLCINLYGIPRFTLDMDIVISMTPENIKKTVELLAKQGYVPRLPVSANDLTDPSKVEDWIDNKNLKAFGFYHEKDNYKVVDILLTSPLNFEESYKNKVVKNVEDIQVNLTSIEDLIKMKEFSGRPQDLSDIEMLKQIRADEDDEND